MTVTLTQIKQISGVTAFNYAWNGSNRALIFNPSLPAFVFDYAPGGSSVEAGLVVGSTAQALYSGATGGSNLLANEVPMIFFTQYVLAGGGVCGYSGCMQNSSSACGPWFVSYNLQNNTYSQNCSAIPNNSITSHLVDVVLDYTNQYLYMFFLDSTTGDGYGVLIFAVPFSSLATFLANLQPPSSYKVAWIQPQNPPSGWHTYATTVVYYNGNFYIVGFDQPSNYYYWIVQYSSITWSSSFPSSAQLTGTIVEVYSGGGAYGGNSFLNYYVSNGQIVTEILAYIPVNSTSNGSFSTIYIYSFNPSNNTPSQLFSLTNAYASLRSINMGGVIVFVQSPSNGTFYISAYDRKTNSYEQSQAISGVLGVLISEPYYAIIFSGSPTNLTITTYQILLDVVPAFVNVTYSNGTLSGQVVNLNGNQPLANVTVYLFTLATQGDDYSSGTQVTSTTTNSSGQFSFSISQAGYYALKIIQS